MQNRGNLGALAAAEQAAGTPVTQADLMKMRSQLDYLMKKEGPQRVPPGALVEYYSDLASGVLPPSNMRLEELRFDVRIDPAGNITASTDPVQVLSQYNFAFRRIVAFAQNPQLVGAAPSLVSFNVQDAGRNFPIFKNNINLQSLLATGGAGNPAVWDGVYITVPGTQVEVTWTVDPRWAVLVGTSQEFGIQLLGDNVVCAPRG